MPSKEARMSNFTGRIARSWLLSGVALLVAAGTVKAQLLEVNQIIYGMD